MYDPSLQRWINRDPAGESGGDNLFEFVENDPVARLDFLGLDCSDPCGDAKKGGLDKGDGGGVICCGGKKYACVWAIGDDSSTGGKIKKDCGKKHEEAHLDDVDCPTGKGCDDSPSRPPFKPGHDECKATDVEIECLKKADCGGDKACESAIAARIKRMEAYKKERCGGKG